MNIAQTNTNPVYTSAMSTGRISGLCLAALIVSARLLPANISEVASVNTQPPTASSLASVSQFAQNWRNSFTLFTTFTFAGYGNALVDVNYPLGITVDGVTFKGSGGYLYVRQEPPAYYYGANFLYGPPVIWSDGDITVTLPANVYTVGWSWGNFYDVEGTTIKFLDGETFSEPGIFGFVGFTSPDPITSFEISSPTAPIIYDEFSFGGEAPEPTYQFLLYGAMAVLVAMFLKRSRPEASTL